MVGDPCPAGDFPTALPAGPVRYVRPGATGGDGTMASPFGTVADALAGAPDGVVIALARGTHAEAVSIAANATLVGACAAETTIRPPTSSTTTGVVHVT
ncbi:MAG: hypothetical protein GWN73_30450, partial [Actinobacteria bacterium]|nr:hypothetical protein [Actinomycetota bacterium]NIU69479.1 hypothetical protein [Actinomycetota bacterium]NIW31348.1 hypothetical protein [Actinomycetota bacterium]